MFSPRSPRRHFEEPAAPRPPRPARITAVQKPRRAPPHECASLRFAIGHAKEAAIIAPSQTLFRPRDELSLDQYIGRMCPPTASTVTPPRGKKRAARSAPKALKIATIHASPLRRQPFPTPGSARNERRPERSANVRTGHKHSDEALGPEALATRNCRPPEITRIALSACHAILSRSGGARWLPRSSAPHWSHRNAPFPECRSERSH